ncbi:unnamed protein product [Nesidiocoris tenuis]|uniref:Uncharacterized protein n=1 Tax=Nesidiocoris tenuis TaxID=355587 RepID=A0A6H5GWH4_9HEMI|nr:unnamed protein product [Nesidiocoris tenuis]
MSMKKPSIAGHLVLSKEYEEVRERLAVSGFTKMDHTNADFDPLTFFDRIPSQYASSNAKRNFGFGQNRISCSTLKLSAYFSSKILSPKQNPGPKQFPSATFSFRRCNCKNGYIRFPQIRPISNFGERKTHKSSHSCFRFRIAAVSPIIPFYCSQVRYGTYGQNFGLQEGDSKQLFRGGQQTANGAAAAAAAAQQLQLVQQQQYLAATQQQQLAGLAAAPAAATFTPHAAPPYIINPQEPYVIAAGPTVVPQYYGMPWGAVYPANIIQQGATTQQRRPLTPSSANESANNLTQATSQKLVSGRTRTWHFSVEASKFQHFQVQAGQYQVIPAYYDQNGSLVMRGIGNGTPMRLVSPAPVLVNAPTPVQLTFNTTIVLGSTSTGFSSKSFKSYRSPYLRTPFHNFGKPSPPWSGDTSPVWPVPVCVNMSWDRIGCISRTTPAVGSERICIRLHQQLGLTNFQSFFFSWCRYSRVPG